MDLMWSWSIRKSCSSCRGCRLVRGCWSCACHTSTVDDNLELAVVGRVAPPAVPFCCDVGLIVITELYDVCVGGAEAHGAHAGCESQHHDEPLGGIGLIVDTDDIVALDRVDDNGWRTHL